MKNLKSFNEMRRSSIHTGIELTPKQINYIFDISIDRKYEFEILVDDNMFYVKQQGFKELWEFDRIQDVKDFIHLKHYIDKDEQSSFIVPPYKALEIIKRNKNLDYSFQTNWPIRWASARGHTEIVKVLLQYDRVDPSDQDNYAIRWASSMGHTEVVKLLLKDPRVDPTIWNNYPIREASEEGHIEIVKLLLQDDRVDPSDMNNYAIRYATIEIAKILINHPKVRNTLDPKDRDRIEEKIYFDENGIFKQIFRKLSHIFEEKG